MIGIDVKVDIREFERGLSRIEKSLVPKALVQALNRTAKGVRTDAKRKIAKRTNIKQKDITKKLRITRATKHTYTAVVKPSSKPFRLAYFIHTNRKKSRKQAGVRVKAWGKQKVYKGSFVGQMKTSKRGKGLSATGEAIFIRTGRKTKYGRSQLKQLYGPTIEQSFRNDEEFQKFLRKSSSARFDKNFKQAFNFQKGKAGF